MLNVSVTASGGLWGEAMTVRSILAVAATLSVLSSTSAATVVNPLGVVPTPTGSKSVIPDGWSESSVTPNDVETVEISYNGQLVRTTLPKDNQGGQAAERLVSPYGSGVGLDDDQDGIIDSFEDEVAARFAPIVIHDKDDANLPANVDWILQRTSLEYYNNNGLLRTDDHVPIANAPLSQSALLGHVGTGSGQTIHSDGTRSKRRQHTFALSDVPRKDQTGSLDSTDWVTYVHAFRNYFGGVTVQYWRAYAFNTGDQTNTVPGLDIDHHGGDWESVQVALGRDLRPLNLRFLRHSDILVKTAQDVQFESGTNHVKVYSEPGGHASHAQYFSGEMMRVGFLQLPVWLNRLDNSSNAIRQESWTGGHVQWPTADWRSHVGGLVTASGGLVNIGEKLAPLNGQQFVRYSGLWGSLGANFSGFWGPAYNETESVDGFIAAWCYGLKASKANFVAALSECHPDAEVD